MIYTYLHTLALPFSLPISLGQIVQGVRLASDLGVRMIEAFLLLGDLALTLPAAFGVSLGNVNAGVRELLAAIFSTVSFFATGLPGGLAPLVPYRAAH